MSNVEGSCLEHLHHVRMNLHGRTLQAPAVDAQEDIGRGKGNALVPVHKRVVGCQAFHQRGGLRHDIVVVTRLGPEEGGFQCPRITLSHR